MPGMSNLDRTIEPGTAEFLKEHPEETAEYTAWNFYGTVGWDEDDGKFFCYVQQYGVLVETVVRDSLEEIMDHCCETYGSD